MPYGMVDQCPHSPLSCWPGFLEQGCLLLGGTRRIPASPAGALLAQLPCGLTQLFCLHALFLPAASQRPHAAVLAPVLWRLSPHTFPSSPQSCQKLVCPGLSLLPLCCLGFFCLCFVAVISVGQKMTACSQSDTLDWSSWKHLLPSFPLLPGCIPFVQEIGVVETHPDLEIILLGKAGWRI